MIDTLRCEDPKETIPSQQTCLYELVLLKKILNGAPDLGLQRVPKSHVSSQKIPHGLGSHDHQRVNEQMRVLRNRFGKLAWRYGKRLRDHIGFTDYDHLHKLNYERINEIVKDLGGMAAALEWSKKDCI